MQAEIGPPDKIEISPHSEQMGHKKRECILKSEDTPPVCIRIARITTALSENPVNPLILIPIALHPGM